MYKLMPLAGVLSIFLSLGGTLVPAQPGAYDPKVTYTYGGLMATNHSDEKKQEPGSMETHSSKAEAFAARVKRRSEEKGGGLYGKVWVGVGIQCMLVAVILVALWFGQMGGVITWWCNVSFP